MEVEGEAPQLRLPSTAKTFFGYHALTFRAPHMLFSIGFGSKNREEKIRDLLKEDPTIAVILAAVHFEWMLKRSILKLGISPTKTLRTALDDIYRLTPSSGHQQKKTYQDIWAREVASRFRNSSLGTVLGNLQRIQSQALKTRGKIIHGNGLVSNAEALAAVSQYLNASEKLRLFVERHKESVDSRLKARLRPR